MPLRVVGADSGRLGLGGIPGPARRLRAATAALVLLSAPLLASGCATNSYAGIPLAAGAGDPELQQLAARARAGDKHAQFDLGMRFEEGRGVTVDLGRAARLYRLAANSSGGPLWVYLPAVGGSPGTVIPADLGPRRRGLAEAALRLQALNRARGMR